MALQKVGLEVNKYYASEIDKHAISISAKHVPCRIDIGDVRTLVELDDRIDLLVGGSPCQDLSIAKKGRLGLDGHRSSLFWDYVRIRDLVKPKWFVLENVASMSKEDKETISKALGVEPILINASLVSAQSRKRLFWTNIPNVAQPVDRGVLLKDILQPDAEVDDRFVTKGKAFCLTATYSHANTTEAGIRNSAEKKQRTLVKLGHIGETDGQANRVYSVEGKSVTLSANGGGLGAKTGLYDVGKIRKLTPIECERLQGLPDNYTEGVAMTNRYKALGNAFHVDVVAHILSYIS
jgi:DNA (cytosine-5)-methyltransferase 3A